MIVVDAVEAESEVVGTDIALTTSCERKCLQVASKVLARNLQGLRSSLNTYMGGHSGLLSAKGGWRNRETVVSSSVLPARTLLIEQRLCNATDMAADGSNECTVIGKKPRSKDV